jgi:hypothetical protein
MPLAKKGKASSTFPWVAARELGAMICWADAGFKAGAINRADKRGRKRRRCKIAILDAPLTAGFISW